MSTTEVITTATPPVVQEARRLIADALRDAAVKTTYAPAIGKEISRKDYLAQMLWDLVTEGQAHFMDGTLLILEDHNDWLATVKYISQHMDGGVKSDMNVGVNVYKVYAGIDPDRI